MRLASTLAILTVASPALAGGLNADRLDRAWSPLPSTHFVAWEHGPSVTTLSARPAAIPAGVVRDAFAAASATAALRDRAIDEIAQGWDPTRRTALEDLRDAQRAYAVAAGGDREARGERFVALLKQVADGSGRSAAREPAAGGDEALDRVYDRVIRDTPDDKLPAIEASETAWIAYRDAFDRFAQASERPDAAKAVREELVRDRTRELPAEAGAKAAP